MPKGLVKTKRDEELWVKAQEQVREEYPEVEADSDLFWRLVNGVYQKMRGGEVEKAGRGPGKGLGLGRGRGLMDGTGPRAGTEECPVTKAVGRPLLAFGPLAALLKAASQLALFDETKIARQPKGSGKGGQFAPKGKRAAPASGGKVRPKPQGAGKPSAPPAGKPGAPSAGKPKAEKTSPSGGGSDLTPKAKAQQAYERAQVATAQLRVPMKEAGRALQEVMDAHPSRDEWYAAAQGIKDRTEATEALVAAAETALPDEVAAWRKIRAEWLAALDAEGEAWRRLVLTAKDAPAEDVDKVIAALQHGPLQFGHLSQDTDDMGTTPLQRVLLFLEAQGKIRWDRGGDISLTAAPADKPGAERKPEAASKQPEATSAKPSALAPAIVEALDKRSERLHNSAVNQRRGKLPEADDEMQQEILIGRASLVDAALAQEVPLEQAEQSIVEYLLKRARGFNASQEKTRKNPLARGYVSEEEVRDKLRAERQTIETIMAREAQDQASADKPGAEASAPVRKSARPLLVALGGRPHA